MVSEAAWLGPPMAVATFAVCGRRWSFGAYRTTAALLAFALSLLWFTIANVGQPLVAPLFIVVLPTVATFWTVSRRRIAEKPAWASVAALATSLGATFAGFVLGVNLGFLRP